MLNSKLPSDRNGWRKLKPMVKMFTKALLNLVPQVKPVLVFPLRHAQSCV
jgi:hypothetical protein